MHRIAKQIHNQILKANKILLIPHQNPDGDALGSMSAVCYYLENIRKPYSTFCLTTTSEKLTKLPHLIKASTSDSVWQNEDHDLIIVLDSGDLKYAGVDELVAQTNCPIINIDHHFSNPSFGNLNLVMFNKSSACELLYDLFNVWRVLLDKDIATALLNGMIFDTEVFSNAATHLSTLRAAAQLLNLGARQQQIQTNFLRNKTLGLLKLWGKGFERLTFNPKYKLAFTVLLPTDFTDSGVAASESGQGLSNFFNDLTGVDIVLVLIDYGSGIVKGSLRTTHDDVDVSALAKIFGGGGHRKASGFSLPGKLVYNEGNWQIASN